MADLPSSALVVGAARSGLAAAVALDRHGVRVRLWDQDGTLDPELPRSVERCFGAFPEAELLDGVALVVKSPGVPQGVPVVAAARAADIPVWSEVELGFRLLPNGVRLIGVTGTNGKTTTTELCGAMLRAAGIPTTVAGNVGTALSSVAEAQPSEGVVVCELSSFQLEDVVELRCVAAALLNVTPDHLDRHGTLADYAAAKLRIFERQGSGDAAVLNLDDPWVAALQQLPGKGRRIGVRAADAAAIGFEESRLLGEHNRQNAAVAAALAREVGADDAAIRAGLRAFLPVVHRLEPVGSIGRVSLWNDSKATNPDATLKALTAFPEGRVLLILGGSDKGADFTQLAQALRGRVLGCFLTGPAGSRMMDPLEAAGVPATDSGTLEQALDDALDESRGGDAVLLSPACASFDEFSSYEERGDAFRRLAAERGAERD